MSEQDIVDRLRMYGDGFPGGLLLMREAAAEIDILLVQLGRAHEQLEALRKQTHTQTDAIITALPYLEVAVDDDGYKPGAVAKVIKQLRKALPPQEQT